MKKFSLLLLTMVIVFSVTSCGREDATTGGKAEEGMLGSVLSSKEEARVKETVTHVSETVSKSVFSGDALVAADFNSGTKPSNIGGDFGGWDKDPADSTQGCRDSFDSVVARGNMGFSVKLDYDVDSPNPAYNGFWMKLNNLDASAYNNLTFYVKGDEEEGYTTVFKVELKNGSGDVGKYYATGVTSDWIEVSIPLKQFSGLSSADNLTEFVIVFEDRMATNKDGIIYIDDIQFR